MVTFDISDSLKQSAINKAIEVGQEALGGLVAPLYPQPKMLELPQVVDENESLKDEDFKILPPVLPVENTKRSEKELEHRATNKAKVWAEVLSCLQAIAKMGVAFSSLEKGDRKYYNFWKDKIEEAKNEGSNLAIPSRYYEVKARVEEFEEEMSELKLDTVGDEIIDMLYESFFYDLQQRNKENKVEPLSPIDAVLQASIIILGNSMKLAMIKLVFKSIRNRNA